VPGLDNATYGIAQSASKRDFFRGFLKAFSDSNQPISASRMSYFGF